MSDTPDHREPTHASDYAGAIYGSIVCTALIGALRGVDVSAKQLTLDVAATMVVLWLAHSWSAIAGERIHLGHGLYAHRVRALAREEWPIVEAGFGPLVALALGWVGVMSAENAARFAIAIGVVQLFAWGFVLGRRVYHEWRGAILSGLGNGAVGIALVLLEIAVAH